MALLLLLSIRALHVSLRRQLVQPVEQLRQAVDEDRLDQAELTQLEQQLPDEAAEILEVFEQLKHAGDDMKHHLTELMTTLPACFWWSRDGRHYAGLSEKSGCVLYHSGDAMRGGELWSWIGDDAVAGSTAAVATSRGAA